MKLRKVFAQRNKKENKKLNKKENNKIKEKDNLSESIDNSQSKNRKKTSIEIKCLKDNRDKNITTIKEREAEFKIIYDQINNFITHKVNNILYISGVPGSGKTFTVSTVINKIIENKKENFVTSFVNCTVLSQKGQIYREILKTFLEKCKINIYNSCLQELRRHLLEGKCSHLVVLDEIDFLMNKNEKVLYNLFDLVQMEGNIMIILLSNTLGKLSTKVESRIGNNRIEFKPYTAEQLERLLKDSNTLPSVKNAKISKEEELVKKFIAKKVASATGDFRKAMDLSLKNTNNVKEINAVVKEYYKSVIKLFYNELNLYQRVLVNLLGEENHKNLEFNENNSKKDKKLDLINSYKIFKTHCKLNNIKLLDYFAYVDVIDDLCDFGFIKVNNREISVCFFKEEIE
ncbi:orc1 [Ecytonucleospora hepatopenaei]|uniref:Origin recognition complex subunit 1 n=1 Tax=Ecytonucleospora hepatopenaei TaxID=646526 RepID=A0A1W0E968_9MICR|nr:orc1 [Ecytonucleospora hepatopenaei]